MITPLVSRGQAPAGARSAPETLGSTTPESPNTASAERPHTIRELLRHFPAYARYKRHLAPRTVKLYVEALELVVRIIGDISPRQIQSQHVFAIEKYAASRGTGPSRMRSVLCALKMFLAFCREEVGLETLRPADVSLPPLPRRKVIFLSPNEVRQFVSAIPLYNTKRSMNLKWLCFRALVEVMLGTAMRTGEALSLKRSSINFETGEATIVGKGDKERTVFFSPRALTWVKEYLTRRNDRRDSLFVLTTGNPLRHHLTARWFRQISERSGLKKQVSARILRHTVATTLLFNGCPIGHIRDILGHTKLETTCRYYLGADIRAAKAAHQRYLTYESGDGGGGSLPQNGVLPPRLASSGVSGS